ncbi:MAG: hypothetical protein WC799_07715 [Desulfobacteraceae bacterium]|jgi:hypothetical protein
MSVGQAGRQATLKNALSLPGRFGLSLDEAESIVKDMALISASFMGASSLSS